MYHGKYLNVLLEDSEGQYMQAFNIEDNTPYASIRDSKERGKYILLTHEDGQIGGLDVEGFFGFPQPYNVYSLDDIPDEVLKAPYHFAYTQLEGFKSYEPPEVFKYNSQLSIREMRISMALNEGIFDKEAVDKYEEEVYKYDGTGVQPVFAN